MNKPAFNPNAPFQAADKPPFDPSVAYESAPPTSAPTPLSPGSELDRATEFGHRMRDRFKIGAESPMIFPGNALAPAGQVAEYLAKSPIARIGVQGGLGAIPRVFGNDKGGGGGAGAAMSAGLQTAVEAVPYVGKALSPLTQPIAQGLENMAFIRAIKAIARPSPAQLEKLKNKLGLGKQLLDERIVTPLTTPGRAEARIDSAKQAAGEEVGNLISGATAKNAPPVDLEAIGINILDDPKLKQLQTVPRGKQAYKQVIDDIETMAANGTLPLDQAHKYRQALDEQINFSRKVPDMAQADQFLIKQRGGINDAMNSSINSLGEGSDALKAANQRYSNLATADELNAKGVARASSNRAIGLTDILAGLGGTAHGGPRVGAVAMGLNKGARMVGDSLMATGAYGASKLLRMNGAGIGAASVGKAPLINAIARALEKRGAADQSVETTNPILGDYISPTTKSAVGRALEKRSK